LFHRKGHVIVRRWLLMLYVGGY